MLQLFQSTRNGLGGIGVLPEQGGVMDQAAIVWEALNFVRSLQPPTILPVMLVEPPANEGE